MRKKHEKEEKKLLNLFVTPDLLKKWINNETFKQEEIILDPSQLEEVEDLCFDIVFTASVCENIVKGTFEREYKGYLTKWELVNCTHEDKIRLIHFIEQKFVSSTLSK